MGMLTSKTWKHVFVILTLSGIVSLIYTRIYQPFLDTRTYLKTQDPQHLAVSSALPEYAVPNTKAKQLTHPPVHTQGRDILDAAGSRFKLASVNWYGGSDEQLIPGGLDVQHRDTISERIRALGFNSVRLPYSDEMVRSNPVIPADRLAANPDLYGAAALDVYTAVVESLTAAGVAVIVNNHITHATWCCGIDPCDAAWFNSYLPRGVCRVRQTEEEWIENWETIMRPLVSNPMVIGADLRNEPRGLWGTMRWEQWAAAAEKVGNVLQRMNEDWLIVVEGTSSSNDLVGVKARPVVLEVPDHVVYSSHVYGWSGWGSIAGPYSRREYASFADSMHENWGYLLSEDIAPVWVGEFGAPNVPNDGDVNYWTHLLKYLHTVDADFGYWAINPRKPRANTTESYGLLRDDWTTLVDDYRMADLRKLMGRT
ncbi:glycoside hydrolase family 5 protein [Coleophoma crateriformis]|uniref:Glycoside hydrolase family 5 protein n=1 Tax=Coleophoma crateriformis TaxID=565419 RepID=A0A3D8T8U8_9HELO|nr:glycoside hydrolase family 5 protein [Coleophoma crateriformis]